jgi:hypothetical protein
VKKYTEKELKAANDRLSAERLADAGRIETTLRNRRKRKRQADRKAGRRPHGK